MIVPSRHSRLAIFLFALVQLALPGALGIVDALSNTDARGSAAHIEETTSKQCRAPHTDECIICRHLSTGATKSDPAPCVFAETVRVERATSVQADPRSVTPQGLHSRAPPETLI